MAIPLEVRDAYKKIGTAQSSALCGDRVFFSNIGFNHLIRKKREPRSRKERDSRFALLKYAKDIIEGKEAEIFYRQSVGAISTMHFWAFAAIIDGRIIKVVVSQVNNERKQFLSIMEDRFAEDNKKDSH